MVLPLTAAPARGGRAAPPAPGFGLALGLALCLGLPPGLPAPAAGLQAAVREAPQARPEAADPDRAELARRLEALLEDPALRRAHVGLLVQAAGTGEVLFDRDAEKLFIAASTTKLVTAAAALRRLGPDHRWRTRLLAAGDLRGDTLRGDLWILGDGDPRLTADEVRAWARQVRDAGVRHVAGDVVGDDRVFEPPIWGRGWTWEDLYSGWGAGVSGLQLSPASARAELLAGPAPGSPATLRFPDPGPVPSLENRVLTGAPGDEVRIHFVPPPEGGAVRLLGWVPAGGDPVRLSLAPAHPTLHLLAVLGRAMEDAGVRVSGRYRRATEEERPEGPVAWERELVSEPLSEVVERLLERSDNQVAESLLRTLGREVSGVGSAEAGLRAVEATLAGWGIAPGAVELADGSGLSRYSRVTPAALVRLLRRILQLPGYEPLHRALPVAAETGTLSRRMAATAAEGNARAKTGSLGGVRALAGYVRDADGERLVFALLVNGYEVLGDVATAIEDLVVEQLALYHSADYPGCPCPRRR